MIATEVTHPFTRLLSALTAFLLLVAGLTVSASPAFAAVQAPAAPVVTIDVKKQKLQIKWTTNNLHVRASPTTKSKSLRIAKKGSALELAGKSSGKWVKLSGAGWVSGDYLTSKSPTKKKKPAPKAKAKASKPQVAQASSKTVYTTANLNVRESASVSSKRLRTAHRGARLTLSGKTSGKWAKLTGAGWVSSSFVTSKAPSNKKAAKKHTVKKPIQSSYHAKARSYLDAAGCKDAKLAINGSDLRSRRNANGVYNWTTEVVSIRSGLGSRLGYVATHECMHHKQGKAYGGEWNRLVNTYNKIYGGRNGLEQNADCATRLYGYKEFNYTKSCSGNRAKSAKATKAGRRS